MRKFLQNRDGASAVESALVALPVLLFIFGVMQTAYTLWIDNMLHYSVNAAARCGAINSITYPCYGNTLTNMKSTANALFIGTANFSSNSNCSGGLGLTGTARVSIFFSIWSLTLTADSCYPT
jgi:Flp pilus assembly protein TadG